MSASFWLLILTFSCIFTEAFFSMFEMAAVTFNKVRLQYYVSKKEKKALWLQILLSKPSRFFGTCLIAIEVALQLGSEASRRFYESIHLDPIFAPVTQIFLVLIFGELAPLFAARRHAEEVALRSVGVVYFLSKALFPFTWLMEQSAKVTELLFKKGNASHLFLSREEIQRAFEEQDVKIMRSEREKMSLVVSQILSLKDRKVKELMIPLSNFPLVPQETKVEEALHLLKKNYAPFLLLYHRSKEMVSSEVETQELLLANPESPLYFHGHSLQFVTEESSLFLVLKQFRKEKIALVLNGSGKATGILPLEEVMRLIFGGKEVLSTAIEPQFFIERTLSGDMLLSDFNREFHAKLSYPGAKTISDLISLTLQHPPSEGEIVHLDSYEICVKEVSLRGTKTLTIRSLI